MDNSTIYFSKTTNRELYKYRNVLEFRDDSYVLVNPISPENIKGMRENMDDSDIGSFDEFLERNWGITPQKLSTAEVIDDLDKVPVSVGATMEEEAPKPKKRGRKPKAKPAVEE